MTTTLSQRQADLPRLVELASRGEDVVITVEGKPKAKLTRADAPPSPQLTQLELQQWMAELAELRSRVSTGKMTPTSEELLNEDRADRV